jgi:uncharacterized membrane protein
MIGIFQATLILAAFLCSLVAGFKFAFSVVVMPGIRSLKDRAFIRAFQKMDGVIQNNKLQALNADALDETAQKKAREDFEPRWNRWNSIRTSFSGLVSALLIILLFKL